MPWLEPFLWGTVVGMVIMLVWMSLAAKFMGRDWDR